MANDDVMLYLKISGNSISTGEDTIIFLPFEVYFNVNLIHNSYAVTGQLKAHVYEN